MPSITKSELLKLQHTLKTDEAIGKKFGISRQAVHQIREKYGINALTNKNKERNEKIVALYKNGTTGTAIAKMYNLSLASFYRIVSNMSKPAKKKK